MYPNSVPLGVQSGLIDLGIEPCKWLEKPLSDHPQILSVFLDQFINLVGLFGLDMK